MSNKPLPHIEINRDLPEGEYVAFAQDAARHERLRIPLDPIPSWAVTLHVSPEDYGKLLMFLSGKTEGRDV